MMRVQDIQKFLKKKVVIFLKTGIKFTGSIVAVNETSIDLMDKFQTNLTVDSEDITAINEVGKIEDDKM